MCFKKKLILRFILTLFILIPGICADALLTNDTTFITQYNVYNSSISHNKDTAESIDDVAYKSFSLCMAYNFGSSETFKISQFINSSKNQSGGFRFSLFLVPFFMLSGYSILNPEYLYIMIKYLKQFLIIYIHKSDGKKRLLYLLK